MLEVSRGYVRRAASACRPATSSRASTTREIDERRAAAQSCRGAAEQRDDWELDGRARRQGRKTVTVPATARHEPVRSVRRRGRWPTGCVRRPWRRSSARITCSRPDGPIGRMVAARPARLDDPVGPAGLRQDHASRGCWRTRSTSHFEPLSAVFSGVADLRKVFEAGQAAAQDGPGHAAVHRRDPPLQPQPAGRLPALCRGRHGRRWSAPRPRTRRSS